MGIVLSAVWGVPQQFCAALNHKIPGEQTHIKIQAITRPQRRKSICCCKTGRKKEREGGREEGRREI